MLLEAGANPDDGESVYHATEAADPACLRALIEHGATRRADPRSRTRSTTSAPSTSGSCSRPASTRASCSRTPSAAAAGRSTSSCSSTTGPTSSTARGRAGASPTRLRTAYQHAQLRNADESAQLLAELGADTAGRRRRSRRRRDRPRRGRPRAGDARLRPAGGADPGRAARAGGARDRGATARTSKASSAARRRRRCCTTRRGSATPRLVTRCSRRAPTRSRASGRRWPRRCTRQATRTAITSASPSGSSPPARDRAVDARAGRRPARGLATPASARRWLSLRGRRRRGRRDVGLALVAVRGMAPEPEREMRLVASALPGHPAIVRREGHASIEGAGAALIHRRVNRLLRLRSFRHIRAAVAGTGFIGVVHVEALRRLGIEVAGVVGSSHARAKAKAAAENLPEPYESFEAMLADERVDVVHLATPNQLHDEQVRAVLAAGKHVVCEKPLAMTSAQTAELLELATGQRQGPRRQLQPALLRAEPACARGDRRRRPRRRSASSAAASCRTGCSTTPTGAGA